MEPLTTVAVTEEDNEHSNHRSVSRLKPTRKCFVNFLKTNLLVLLMLGGVVMGVIVGVALNGVEPRLTRVQIFYIRFPGDMFIQSMQMLIIPIVMSSLFCSTAEIDLRSSGKIGLRAMVYYLSTLVMASLLGIFLSLTIRPGERTSGRPAPSEDYNPLSSNPVLAFIDLIRNMIPDNIVDMCFMSRKTSEVITTENKEDGTILQTENNTLLYTNRTAVGNDTGDNTLHSQKTLVISKVPGINMIGLVVTSIVFGCVTSAVGEEARPFLDFMKALRVISFTLVSAFIWYSPIGIAFLIAANLAEIEEPGKTFKGLALFTVIVLTGLVVHGFVVLSVIYLMIVRKNPVKFIAGMFPALVFAFGSNSSNATLPVTMKCLEENNHVDSRVTKLITSVGATVNMDGSCLYMPMMAIFVAQINGIPLSGGELVSLSILAVSVAIGAGGVAGSGLIYMIMILTSMGLPTKDISTILAVDWFLIRCRTVINVLGDAIGAGIIAHLSRLDLVKMNRKRQVEQNGEPNTKTSDL